jgi:hypothetical protein
MGAAMKQNLYVDHLNLRVTELKNTLEESFKWSNDQISKLKQELNSSSIKMEKFSKQAESQKKIIDR